MVRPFLWRSRRINDPLCHLSARLWLWDYVWLCSTTRDLKKKKKITPTTTWPLMHSAMAGTIKKKLQILSQKWWCYCMMGLCAIFKKNSKIGNWPWKNSSPESFREVHDFCWVVQRPPCCGHAAKCSPEAVEVFRGQNRQRPLRLHCAV